MTTSEEGKKKRQGSVRSSVHAQGESIVKIAIAYHLQGDQKRAEMAYREAISSGLLDSALFINLGTLCQTSNRNKEAIALYRKAIEISPDNPIAYMNLGSIYQSLGKLDQALAFTLKSLALKPNNADANLNLGSIHQSLGNLDQALAFTLKSLEIRPNNADAYLKLGGIHQSLCNFDQALTFTLKSLELKPDNANTLITLGGIYLGLGNPNKALEATLKSLKLRPDNATSYMNLGGIYKKLGNLDLALSATLKSLEIEPYNATAQMNLGRIYIDLGKLHRALAATLKSIELNPINSTSHMNLGTIYKSLGQYKNALASTKKSLELNPDNSDAYMNLGSIYLELGELEKALTSTLTSLELKASNPNALINLSSIYKNQEKLEDAKIAANKALEATNKDSPSLTLIFDFFDSINEEDLLKKAIRHIKSTLPNSSLRVTIYEARVLFRQKMYKESWDKLPEVNLVQKEFNDWYSTCKYHAFRAEIAEKNGCHEEAFSSIIMSQNNPEYSSLNHSQEFIRIDEYISLSRHLACMGDDGFFDGDPEKTADAVFLIGFPRSGTTLLDTVLRSHPEIEVLEEKDQLLLTENFAIRNLQKKISNFNLLNSSELNAMRSMYRRRLHFHSKGEKRLIIDKLPLHTIAIPLINLLFPRAKVIFALRHPCDSILSCFQQSFKPNTAMSNFTTLERSVDYYNKVMNAWMTYNKNLHIDFVVSRYEDLLSDFDESISTVLKHLNLPWDDSVRNYRNTAINRGYINTPSSSQVIQPLYKTSVGRWKNYQKHFSKHMETLNPWIDYFGYNS